MAKQTVTTLDQGAIAAGVGELKVGGGSARVVVGGTTIAYIKKTRVAVRAAHVKRLPKKLGTPVPEANGTWANVAVKDTAAARAMLQFVAEKAAQS
jgi:hypothetical protein